MKFPIKDFFRKCDQILSKLQIWSHFLEKSLMENFIFYAVCVCARNNFSSNLMLVKKDFNQITETYWNCLKGQYSVG